MAFLDWLKQKKTRRILNDAQKAAGGGNESVDYSQPLNDLHLSGSPWKPFSTRRLVTSFSRQDPMTTSKDSSNPPLFFSKNYGCKVWVDFSGKPLEICTHMHTRSCQRKVGCIDVMPSWTLSTQRLEIFPG